MKNLFISLLCAVLIPTAHATVRSSASYSITSETFDGGGQAASSASFSLQASAVELGPAGGSASTSYSAQHGFWAAFSNFGLDSDDDNDGMPNAFELAYGLDPNSAADADTDSDGDGFTNLAEYLSGTSPVDAASAVRIVEVTEDAGQVIIKFQSGTGRNYSAEWSSELAPASWTPFASGVPGTGGIVEVINSGTSGEQKRFFRIRVQP